MEPGRELDKLVAEAIGQKGNIPLRYSTDIAAAWKAWEWLEENTFPCLGREWKGLPTVLRLEGGEIVDTIAEGQTYPHAICLAVLATKEAGNVQG